MDPIATVINESAIRRLSTEYAIAADERDGERYAQVFEPDGRLIVRNTNSPGESPIELSGHSALSKIPLTLAKTYARTMHFVGQSLFSIAADTAQGTVYCQASHLSKDGEAASSVLMHIRYEDQYRWTVDLGWRIASRTAWIYWTETREAHFD
jgi:hypothetical protein